MELSQIRTVLHVLPHPGGGGEAYVDALSGMDGYRFERLFLASSPEPRAALRSVLRTAPRTMRRIEVLHVHGEVAGAICLPALAVRRSLLTLHGLNLLRRSHGTRRTLAELNLRLLVRAAHGTICVSESERQDVRQAVGSTASSRVTLIHNGVEPSIPPSAPERFAARAALGLTDADVAAVWVGGLEPVKDPLLAARAAVQAARDMQLVLLFAGDGPLRVELERVVASAPDGVVRALGFRRDVARVLAAADAFVNSSAREGLAFSVLEAMSVGLPVVVSDAPGNLDAVGDAGLVARRDDAASFTEAFLKLREAESRQEIGRRGQERVRSQFRREEMVDRTKELYDEMVARGR